MMNLRRKKWITLAVDFFVFALLLNSAWTCKADEIKGRVANVTADKNEITVTESFKNWTFLLKHEGKVFLNDRESKLHEIRAGDDATVIFSRQGENFQASLIRCRRK